MSKSYKAGHIDGEGLSFRGYTYITEVMELARCKAEKKGRSTYLYKNSITIHPLDRKARPPIAINWQNDLQGSIWSIQVEPVIRLVAGEVKKGQSTTVSIDIETAFSRYPDQLPKPKFSDPPHPPPTSAPARTT